jgi:hypothetical protein
MRPNLTALSLLFLLAPFARAQDMPLSQILIDGEGWKKVEGGKRPEILHGILAGTGDVVGKRPACYVTTGSTLYAGLDDGRALIAFTLDRDRNPRHPAPFAPLRLKHGENGIKVTWLEVDREGRIYAATEIGVQVFDPTGRLCGVLTPAAPGTPTLLAFEDDQLTLWIGETKYARKLNTTGVK